jgi:hypothetical protein
MFSYIFSQTFKILTLTKSRMQGNWEWREYTTKIICQIFNENNSQYTKETLLAPLDSIERKDLRL